jgi:hypothetical protein
VRYWLLTQRKADHELDIHAKQGANCLPNVRPTTN